MINKTRYVGVIIDYLSSKDLLPDYPEDGKYMITGKISGSTEESGHPLYAEYINNVWKFTSVSSTLPGGLTPGDVWIVKNKNQYLIRVINSSGYWLLENLKYKRFYKLSSDKLVNSIKSDRTGRYYLNKISINDESISYTSNEYYWDNNFIASIITDYIIDKEDIDSYYQRAIGTVRVWNIRNTVSFDEKVISYLPDDSYDRSGEKKPMNNFYVFSVEFNNKDSYMNYNIETTPWASLIDTEISENYYKELTDFMLEYLVGLPVESSYDVVRSIIGEGLIKVNNTDPKNPIISCDHDSQKQDTLVSGTNIKTINNYSLLGEGNIDIKVNPEVKKILYKFDEPTNILDASSDFNTIYDVLKNGIEIYENDDYTISDNIITFNVELSADDKICCKGI